MKEETKAITKTSLSAGIELYKSIEDIRDVAKSAAQSRLCGTSDVNQTLVLMLRAHADGVNPIYAATRYHIIKDKISLTAEAMSSDFLTTGGKIEYIETSDTIASAYFRHPKGAKHPEPIEFTIDDAKKAGLIKADSNWVKNPASMLAARLKSKGIRLVCPQITQGLYTPEELEELSAPSTKVTIETENGTEEITTPDNRPKTDKVADMVLQNPEPAKEEPQVPQEAKPAEDIEDAQEITRESLIASIRSKRGIVGDDIFKSSMKGCGLTGKLTLQDLPINTLAELDIILEDAVKETQG